METQILAILKIQQGKTVLWNGKPDGFFRSLPMSINDWECLKMAVKRNIENYKRWPAKFTTSSRDNFGFSCKDVNFCKLLEGVYGGSWYFDDINLVQGDKTIVTVKKGMTFAELLEAVETSKNLKKS